MFGSFPQSDVDIVSKDGCLRGSTKAIIDSKSLIIPDATVLIEVGDEIRRRIPSGVEEAFEVIDPTYHEGLAGIPAHYQVKIRRKGTFPRGGGGNYTFNVSGTNARVNFKSHDHSINIAADHSVFDQIRGAIQSGITDEHEREQLTALTNELEERSGNRERFTAAYQRFIAATSNHMTIISPFLPALSGFLTYGS